MTQLNLIIILIKGFAVVRLRRIVMKRFNNKLILITILTCILILSGCNKIRLSTYDASKEEAGTKVTLDQNNKEIPIDGQDNAIKDADISPTIAEPTEKPSPVSVGIQPTANKQLMIYTIDSNSGDIGPSTALIPEGEAITPELIVDTVVESMADESLMIGIENVSTEGDAVIVSFYSDQPPLKDVGGGIETAILNAIAQSLIDNLDNYSKVIYRVEGNAYVSDHYELGINEVYLVEN